MPGNQQSFTQWSSSGGAEQGAGADRSPGLEPHWRSPKDKMMAAWAAGPDTQYPDGYLGTQPSSTRRQDKLLNGVYRTNTRSYSRGVHKGERINPGDYVWPDEFNPMSGIENQLTGRRFPTGTIGQVPTTLTNDGKPGPIRDALGRPQAEVIDIQRQSMLKSLLPQWR